MKKKALAVAIASALAAPSAWAATDTSGMQFTSASEGFYASLRMEYQSSDGDSGDGRFINDGSRIGLRGTNDMGGGLEGFYQWEAGVDMNDGGGTGASDTRLGLVGIRGNFGQVQVGSFWTADYNYVGVLTDLHTAGFGDGGIDNDYYNRQREGRSQAALEYQTPDLNGFQGAFRVSTDGVEGEDLGLWNLSAKYNIQGFTVAGAYNVLTDHQSNEAFEARTAMDAVTAVEAMDASCSTGAVNSAGNGCDESGATFTPAVVGVEAAPAVAARGAIAAKKSDLTSWTVGLGYAQDNWYVGAIYGEDDTSEVVNEDGDSQSDSEYFSIGAGVTVDKVEINADYHAAENADAEENTIFGIGATYRFTASSRVYVKYISRDYDSSESEDDQVRLGLRHDF